MPIIERISAFSLESTNEVFHVGILERFVDARTIRTSSDPPVAKDAENQLAAVMKVFPQELTHPAFGLIEYPTFDGMAEWEVAGSIRSPNELRFWSRTLYFFPQVKENTSSRGERKNLMAKKRKVWTKPAEKKSTSSLTDALKAEVESKAADLIENVLKPKSVQPPPENAKFNYITDIGTKWHRNYFYFVSTYACPGPNAISPKFEVKFARMEYVGDGKFALSFMRHTGAWVGLYNALSVDECMKAIQDDGAFVP